MYINEIFDKLGNLGNTEEIVISFQYHLDGIIKWRIVCREFCVYTRSIWDLVLSRSSCKSLKRFWYKLLSKKEENGGRCGRKVNAKIKFFRIWRYIRCRELRTKQKESAICTFTFSSYVQHLPRFVLCFSNWSAREATDKTQMFFFFFFLTKLHCQVPWIQIISANGNLSLNSLGLKALFRVSFLTIRIRKEESHVDSFFLLTCNLSKRINILNDLRYNIIYNKNYIVI